MTCISKGLTMSEQIWVNADGDAVCERHIGDHLRAAIAEDPGRTWYETLVGSWWVSVEFNCEECFFDMQC
ncbi:hypothetical protein MSTE_04515 [Mycobacteroides stephanolepidis]|uniref:Uncharacterized protein n=1 Tax=[Mycobacterium] stephanolepidis TaxID=1520670 RepID=A0A1Z4F3L9_9MYCO|nr:hypothetical protein MSTE_04515 [[Mycobacterium] stephanolepidis]